MIKLAIFASGRGTNAEAIITYFAKNGEISTALIVSNNPRAGVLEVAKKFGIPAELVTQHDLYSSSKLPELLRRYGVDFIALAGFMRLVPPSVLEAFPGKVVNIHPALLPRHGGKGMYGERVHEAVLRAGDKETGITIHHVNERFDEGEVIFQAKCAVEPGDDVAALQAKVQQLEHLHYPKVIEQLIKIKETVST